jgi:antitoxin component of MazEF toxin-antitoxin module
MGGSVSGGEGDRMKRARSDTHKNSAVVSKGKPKPTLEQLLEQVTEDNLHEEIDMGPAVGKEER